MSWVYRNDGLGRSIFGRVPDKLVEMCSKGLLPRDYEFISHTSAEVSPNLLFLPDAEGNPVHFNTASLTPRSLCYRQLLTHHTINHIRLPLGLEEKALR